MLDGVTAETVFTVKQIWTESFADGRFEVRMTVHQIPHVIYAESEWWFDDDNPVHRHDVNENRVYNAIYALQIYLGETVLGMKMRSDDPEAFKCVSDYIRTPALRLVSDTIRDVAIRPLIERVIAEPVRRHLLYADLT